MGVLSGRRGRSHRDAYHGQEGRSLKLLDTDTCIGLLRGNGRVLAHRETELDSVATTWITAAELFYGAAKSAAPARNQLLVGEFLSSLPVLGLDAMSASVLGDAKALLERRGARLADADLFIAAIAISHGAVVVTGNRRHYERIPGVSIEDWLRG